MSGNYLLAAAQLYKCLCEDLKIFPESALSYQNSREVTSSERGCQLSGR